MAFFVFLTACAAHLFPLCVNFYRWQQRTCRYEPQLYAEMASLSSELYDKAKVIVSRVLTPKQFETFSAQDYLFGEDE